MSNMIKLGNLAATKKDLVKKYESFIKSLVDIKDEDKVTEGVLQRIAKDAANAELYLNEFLKVYKTLNMPEDWEKYKVDDARFKGTLRKKEDCISFLNNQDNKIINFKFGTNDEVINYKVLHSKYEMGKIDQIDVDNDSINIEYGSNTINWVLNVELSNKDISCKFVYLYNRTNKVIIPFSDGMKSLHEMFNKNIQKPMPDPVSDLEFMRVSESIPKQYIQLLKY